MLEEKAGGIAAGMPCYLKDHSYGEYVFDHGWADAYQRAGGRYYPKLQVSVPFTPVTGPRLLAPTGDLRANLARSLSPCRQVQASSVHVTFLPEDDWALGGKTGYAPATSSSTGTMPAMIRSRHFLGALASRKRKTIHERTQAAREAGIACEWLTGSDITERHWDEFFAFYMDTGSRKWGSPYLTRRFFSLIGERMARHILLVMCKRNGRTIAGALNFIGAEALYGRNWGAVEHHPCLHFEACYYQAIEFAIAHKLARVEAGAQGPHKLARGYLPEQTYSAHWIRDPALRRAVADYLKRERAAVGREIAMLARSRRTARKRECQEETSTNKPPQTPVYAAQQRQFPGHPEYSG